MRQYKFRIYVKEHPFIKAYIDLMNEDFDYWICPRTGKVYEQEICKGLEELEGAIVEQYTGLKDRKRKEIYEGDILHVVTGGFHPEVFRTYIKYENCKFCLANGRSLFYFGQSDLTTFSDGEIIGNVHENPELLEGLE